LLRSAKTARVGNMSANRLPPWCCA